MTATLGSMIFGNFNFVALFPLSGVSWLLAVAVSSPVFCNANKVSPTTSLNWFLKMVDVMCIHPIMALILLQALLISGSPARTNC